MCNFCIYFYDVFITFNAYLISFAWSWVRACPNWLLIQCDYNPWYFAHTSVILYLHIYNIDGVFFLLVCDFCCLLVISCMNAYILYTTNVNVNVKFMYALKYEYQVYVWVCVFFSLLLLLCSLLSTLRVHNKRFQLLNHTHETMFSSSMWKKGAYNADHAHLMCVHMCEFFFLWMLLYFPWVIVNYKQKKKKKKKREVKT